MRQQATSYSENGDAKGRTSWRSSFLGDPGANFFCTAHDLLEILPHPGHATLFAQRFQDVVSIRSAIRRRSLAGSCTLFCALRKITPKRRSGGYHLKRWWVFQRCVC
jgi:hypothetical protein